LNKNIPIIVIVGVVSAAIGAFVGAVALGLTWNYEQSHAIAEYLPSQPRLPGVTIHASHAKNWGSFATMNFTFSTGSGVKAEDAARLFEPQLASEGWKRLASASESDVATTTWRHGQKINGHLYLVFSVLQLDQKGEYLATMTTVPYWPYP
jgi:amino acid transporter